MQDKLKAMLLASFAADSLAMPVHWIYDTDEIERRFGRVEDLLQPPDKSYHAVRKAGEVTHYGDQMMLLLESVAACSGFDLEHFGRSWREMFVSYDGYFDHATKTTLKNFADGRGVGDAGSSSADLAGAARISPLVYYYADDLDKLVLTCRRQTAMTHNNAMVIDAAEFFARAAHKVLHGATPRSAFEELTKEPPGSNPPIKQWVEEGMAAVGQKTRDVVGTFGRSCAANGAFRSVIHITVSYQQNLREALIENVMAGGDSAARGLLIGMLLGAHGGMEAMPPEWPAKLAHYQRLMDLMTEISHSKNRP